MRWAVSHTQTSRICQNGDKSLKTQHGLSEDESLSLGSVSVNKAFLYVALNVHAGYCGAVGEAGLQVYWAAPGWLSQRNM